MKGLFEQLVDVNTKIAELQAMKEDLSQRVFEQYDNVIKGQLKDYGCGTATIDLDGGGKVKVTVPKYVKYDQDMLSDIWNDLSCKGQDPHEYIKVKLDVSETAYKNWPSSLQEKFEPARTVKPGKPRIDVKV